jgi:hypothetical protein
MIFGDNKQLSLNHSSIATEVFVSDPQIADIGLFNATTDFDMLDYDKREIVFFDKVGPVQVSSVSQSYYANLGAENLPSKSGSGFLGSLLGKTSD